MKKQTDNNIINKQTNKIKSTQLETRKNDFGKMMKEQQTQFKIWYLILQGGILD